MSEMFRFIDKDGKDAKARRCDIIGLAVGRDGPMTYAPGDWLVSTEANDMVLTDMEFRRRFKPDGRRATEELNKKMPTKGPRNGYK